MARFAWLPLAYVPLKPNTLSFIPQTFLTFTQLVIPAWMGLYMDWEVRQTSWAKRCICYLHMFTVVLGLFMTIGGTTTTIQSIVEAYKTGDVGSPFSCT